MNAASPRPATSPTLNTLPSPSASPELIGAASLAAAAPSDDRPPANLRSNCLVESKSALPPGLTTVRLTLSVPISEVQLHEQPGWSGWFWTGLVLATA